MSKKRPAPGPATGVTNRNAKRLKTSNVRSILSQTSDKSLNSNGDLDVGSFIKSREFEIRALQNAMAVSKKELSQRAFQQVPRDLRRRTASHDVKRVPKRLRNRAAKEMIIDNTPQGQSNKKEKSTRKQLRAQNAKNLPDLAKRIQQQKEREDKRLAVAVKNVANQLIEPKPKTPKFKKRQVNKFWLPTHIWHAKRARMTPPSEPLWRFAIPLTPTEKTARVTGRASRLRGCVAWDTSYISTISVRGDEESIIKIFRALHVPEALLSGKHGSTWRAGGRSCRSWIREPSNATRLIAPIIVIWQPQNESGADRQVFIRVHPSAFLQTWEEVLVLAKSQEPPASVEDLRSVIGSIKITGPAALESLIGILHQIPCEDGSDTDSHWIELAAIQDSHSMPSGTIISILTSDPRLGQPHQTMSMDDLRKNDDTMLLGTTVSIAGTDSSHSIFDVNCRRKSVRSQQTQSAINKRKAAVLPGQKPQSIANDLQVPIMLLANNHVNKSHAIGSWTVLMPQEFVLPTWHSLMHYPVSTGGNPRFGGLDEERQLSFEAGRPWFPGDFPGTAPGWQWEMDQRARRKAEWNAKPKSRRVEWSTLDLGTGVKGEVGEGWACDWQFLCGKPGNTTEANSAEDPAIPSDLCQITSPTIDAPETFPINGLTTIRVGMVNRGRPSPCARIYRLPTEDPDLRQSWLAQLDIKKHRSSPSDQPLKGDNRQTQTAQEPPSTTEAIPETPLEADDATNASHGAKNTHDNDNDNPNDDDNDEVHPVVPSANDLVGFITAGNFNLAQGKGTGMGCVVWARVVNEAKRGKNSDSLHGLCIVRDAGEKIGRLARWETVS